MLQCVSGQRGLGRLEGSLFEFVLAHAAAQIREDGAELLSETLLCRLAEDDRLACSEQLLHLLVPPTHSTPY